MNTQQNQLIAQADAAAAVKDTGSRDLALAALVNTGLTPAQIASETSFSLRMIQRAHKAVSAQAADPDKLAPQPAPVAEEDILAQLARFSGPADREARDGLLLYGKQQGLSLVAMGRAVGMSHTGVRNAVLRTAKARAAQIAVRDLPKFAVKDLPKSTAEFTGLVTSLLA